MRESNANQNPGWHTQLDMRIKKNSLFCHYYCQNFLKSTSLCLRLSVSSLPVQNFLISKVSLSFWPFCGISAPQTTLWICESTPWAHSIKLIQIYGSKIHPEEPTLSRTTHPSVLPQEWKLRVSEAVRDCG